jgi:hypothetical protein
VASRFHCRAAVFGLALTSSVALTSAIALASFDMVVGARSVVPNKPITDCAARAESALNGVMKNAIKAGADGTNWLGFGPNGTNNPSAAAVIQCFQVDTGYVVTFTCSAEVPPNTVTATTLCNQLTAAFGAQSTSSLGLGANGEKR